MDFVLPLMKTEGPQSPLAYAFSACAYAALGNRPNVRVNDVTLAAIVQYHRALQALQVSLNDKDASRSDATVCAVLLLAMYEVCPWANTCMHATNEPVRIAHGSLTV